MRVTSIELSSNFREFRLQEVRWIMLHESESIGARPSARAAKSMSSQAPGAAHVTSTNKISSICISQGRGISSGWNIAS